MILPRKSLKCSRALNTTYAFYDMERIRGCRSESAIICKRYYQDAPRSYQTGCRPRQQFPTRPKLGSLGEKSGRKQYTHRRNTDKRTQAHRHTYEQKALAIVGALWLLCIRFYVLEIGQHKLTRPLFLPAATGLPQAYKPLFIFSVHSQSPDAHALFECRGVTH